MMLSASLNRLKFLGGITYKILEPQNFDLNFANAYSTSSQIIPERNKIVSRKNALKTTGNFTLNSVFGWYV